jgi:hypothetical protein
MIGLFCFVLAVLASPFKLKLRLEAANAVLRHQLTVDRERRGHYLEGHAGEYIMPNWTVYQHESRLYADVEAYQDGTLNWSAPRDPYYDNRLFGSFTPPALRVTAMEQVGMFTPKGLKAVSEIWASLE